MFKKSKPFSSNLILQFPHCDPRILHGPKECVYCDAHPEWQSLREMWEIAFTGYQPEGKELPCPADYARGKTINFWPGNIAKKEEK